MAGDVPRSDWASRDCPFMMQDAAGHVFNYKKGRELKGKPLAPGTWAAYPMKCSGITVFLH